MPRIACIHEVIVGDKQEDFELRNLRLQVVIVCFWIIYQAQWRV